MVRENTAYNTAYAALPSACKELSMYRWWAAVTEADTLAMASSAICITGVEGLSLRLEYRRPLDEVLSRAVNQDHLLQGISNEYVEVDTYSVNKVVAAQTKVRSRYVWVKCCPNDIGVVRCDIGRSQASDIEIGDVGI